MKPKQYIEKYFIDKTTYFSRNDFIDDFADDFKAMIATTKNVNVTVFENCVNNAYTKWNNIFNGSAMAKESSEKFWKFFFATVVVPTRNIYFPDWKQSKLDHRIKHDPDFARRYNNWKMYHSEDGMYANMNRERRQDYDDFSTSDWFRTLLHEGFTGMMERIKLKASCECLSISLEEVTTGTVKERFRMLAKMVHPDVADEANLTVSAEKFNLLIKARDTLLDYCTAKAI